MVTERKIAVCGLCHERIDLSRPAGSGSTLRLADHRRKAHPGKRGRIPYQILREIALSS